MSRAFHVKLIFFSIVAEKQGKQNKNNTVMQSNEIKWYKFAVSMRSSKVEVGFLERSGHALGG